jgi:hypothetical protein
MIPIMGTVEMFVPDGKPPFDNGPTEEDIRDLRSRNIRGTQRREWPLMDGRNISVAPAECGPNLRAFEVGRLKPTV